MMSINHAEKPKGGDMYAFVSSSIRLDCIFGNELSPRDHLLTACSRSEVSLLISLRKAYPTLLAHT